MPTIDEELVQNAKAVFNSQVIINSANDLKTKDGSSFGNSSGGQATLYQHTIDIAAGGLGLHTYITALSEKNTVIDSIQDLVSVFGNTKLMATGSYGPDSDKTALLEVGTSLTDTYVHSSHGSKMSLSNWANYGPDENFLEITDSVTAM